MKKVQLHPFSFALLLALFGVAPTAAFAFVTVDTLPWPSRGGFPAYPADEVRPTRLWVQGGVMRDDNILRLEDGPADTVGRVGLGLRHDQRVIGRQRLILEGRGDYYKFDRFSELDHFAYSLAGIWAWEIGNDLAGTLSLGRDRRLVDLSEAEAPIRDMLTSTRLDATAGYLLTPRLRLTAGVGTTRGDRPLRAEAETRATAWSAGAEYVSPLGNRLGLEYRRAEGEASTPETVAPGVVAINDFTEDEIAFVAAYSPGATLRTDFRVGRTTREYSDVPGREFEGATFRAGVDWFPGNKTLLRFAAYREPRSILDIAASHVVVTGLSFGPRWAVTNKLVLAATLVRERREFEGSAGAVLLGLPVRDELIYTARFGVGWEPMRHWELGLGFDFGERESNFARGDYKYTAAMLNVAWRY